METIILYVDDPAFAREHLARRPPEAAPGAARHWLLVGCAPRMTRRISKWVSRSAREQWRDRWLDRVRGELAPLLCRPGDRLTVVPARSPLVEMTRQLRLEHGAAVVIDARRPRLGVELAPVAPDMTPAGQSAWALPGAMIGMGALLVLANELSE